MQSKLDEPLQVAGQVPPAPAHARRLAAKTPIDLPPTRADATWQASSFDLAQGLEVKVMESKLSIETLDQLFRS